MQYRIFTDATSDLSEKMIKGLPAIEVIPMNVMLDDQPYKYGLNEELSAKRFYEELRSGKFGSTSQINPATYEEYFQKSLLKGEDILYLGFSSGMSNTGTSAALAASQLQKEYPDRKIICIDTLCASVGEGFLVCEAARRQGAGMSLEDLAQWVEEYKLQVCHWFIVDTFEYLKHGGRVSAAAATIGTTLNIKPLLHVTEEGKLQVKEKPRGRNQASNSLLRKIEEGWKPKIGKRIVIGHGDAFGRALFLKEKIQEKIPDAHIEIEDIGAVIGSHTGPGMLAVIYWGSNR